LFKRLDVTELKNKLSELIDDAQRRVALGNAAREKAERVFSMDRMVNDYVTLYEDIAAVLQKTVSVGEDNARTTVRL